MKFCLIGEKLSHSYSQKIHSVHGLNYGLVELNKEDLTNFCNNCEYAGFNVTIPYKKEIMPLLHGIDDEALKIGAVNIVKNVNGKLYGFNTDAFGFSFMLKQASISLKNKVVAILGTGGAKNTAEYIAKNHGAKKIIIVSRSGEINYNNIYEQKDIEIIVNATPVGTYPNNYETLLDLTKFEKLEGVVDCIYNPFITGLIYGAKNKNIKYTNGLNMLVAQALKAQEIWLNKKFTNEEILSVAESVKKDIQNIVLIGMPSCGKSTIGKILAQKLGKKFVDLDEEIYKSVGKTPSQLIEEFGEEYFRNVETNVAKEISKNNKMVIATGGGAVLKKENQMALKQNSVVVYIKRDLSKLVLADRPISKQKGIEKLYSERAEIYSGFCDVAVENNESIETCVKEIESLLWKF